MQPPAVAPNRAQELAARDGVLAGDAPRPIRKLRVLAACSALTGLAFVQDAGLVVPDTKVDLMVNPLGWLSRTLSLWNPTGSFGQVQDQAYGYLWPMGPFFALGQILHVPTWVTQRLWWSLLLCLAFLGVVKLAGRLNIGTPNARLIAGVAFALSPRILTQLGATSVEAWPSAIAPWVLLPLIGLRSGGPMRRPLALSALAVLCAGGVNATAVFAVVPPALLWLGTLQPMRRRLAALAGWCGAVLLATFWWLVPLLVLGRYSPPFLDYIESARVTTSVTDMVTALRGATYWPAYLANPFGPAMPSGYRLAYELPLIMATIVVAGFGLLGLSRRGIPHRRFLVACLILGVALVGLGHASGLAGTPAGFMQTFLDGVGAPLRNVHKFDVLLRLPLVLGLAHLVGTLELAGRLVRGGPAVLRQPGGAHAVPRLG